MVSKMRHGEPVYILKHLWNELRNIRAKQDAEKAELDKQTAQAQGEADKAKAEADAAVKKINAEAKAEQTRISAEAEADANRVLNDSITDNLIRMKEAEARLKHGWVTVNGANTVVTEDGGENK